MSADRDFVNLNDVENNYSRIELFKTVAEVLKNENIDYVNKNAASVIPRDSIYSKYIKRFLDIVLSIIALICMAPINIIICIITFFDVGTPVIFRQARPGRNEKEFTIIKFRNMTFDVDENGDLLPASKRVTKWGRFVRKTSLDELLNFWSILKGDMSIIGPRPLEMVYLDRYSERHKMRMAVKPGLECPILQDLDHRITWNDHFENEIYYVENVSFALDVKMIFYLFKMVFDKKSTNIRGNALRGGFMGYDKEGNTIDSQEVPRRIVERALFLIDERHRKLLN